MVWGDLVAELYADREGNQQISLNLTTTQISFSPFGKSEQRQEQAQPLAGATQTTGGLDQAMPGQGQETPPVAEDEIPF